MPTRPLPPPLRLILPHAKQQHQHHKNTPRSEHQSIRQLPLKAILLGPENIQKIKQLAQSATMWPWAITPIQGTPNRLCGTTLRLQVPKQKSSINFTSWTPK